MTQGSCSGAPSDPYFSLSKRSKKSVQAATTAPTRVPSARKASLRSRVISALWVTSSGITVIGAPEWNTTCAASGST